MGVAVDGHGGADLVVALQAADGDGDVVDHAEALAVIGEGVVKSAAEADGNFVGQALAGGEDGSTGGEPEGVGQLARVRDLHFHFFALGERAGLELLHVFGFVDQKDILIAGGLGLEEIGGVGDAGGDEAVADPAVLFGVKDVVANQNLPAAEQNLKSYLASTPDRSDWPEHASARIWLGKLYEAEGKRPEAAEQYRAALQLEPRRKEARTRLERLEKGSQ